MLRLSVLICAAVMSFIMCSDATRAAPIMTQQHNVLTRPHAPQSPFSIGLPSTETSRRTLSITDRWSNPQHSFSYSQSGPDTTQNRVTKADGARPASSVFTKHPQHREQKDNEHSYYSYSGIIRKSPPKISSSQIWQHQKFQNEGGVPRSDSSNEDRSFYSSQTAGRWRTPLTPRGSYQLPAVVPWSTSRGIQSGTFLNPPTSISNRAEVTHRHPPSITHSSQRPQKEGRSYLFKDSQTSQSGLSNVAIMTRKQSQNNVHQLYPGQTQSFTKYQPSLKHPTPEQGKKVEDSALKSDLGSRVTTTTKASKPDNKPEQSTKNIFGFRGFKSLLRQAVTESSSSKQRPTSQRYNFGKDYQFKIANKYPSLSPKYSFRLREAATATTPGTLIQTVSTSTTIFKEKNDASTDRNTDRNTDRGVYRRIQGLKRFHTKPLGGTKAEKSATLQKGFKLMKWQTQRPQNINAAGKREELLPLPKSAGSPESIFRPTPDKQTPQTHTQQHSITPSSSHKSAASLKAAPTSQLLNQTKLVSMRANLFNTSTSSTVRGRRVQVKPTTKAPTSNTGCTVAIVRLPKLPTRVKAVTYADILGSASFSGVRATSQTPIADKEYFPNMTTTTEQPDHGGKNTTESPEANTEDETEEFIKVEGNKFEIQTSDLLLDNEGSGAFNMSDTLSTRSKALGEDLLELNYLRTSTGNISFKSVQLSQTGKQ